MQFMCDNVPEAAEEIRVVYIESMGRTISALFRAYHAQLMKLELEMTGRHDLIAVEVRVQDMPSGSRSSVWLKRYCSGGMRVSARLFARPLGCSSVESFQHAEAHERHV